MFKVKVFTIGKAKEAWLIEAIAEYEKRLTGQMELEWFLARNEPHLVELCADQPNLVAFDPAGELLTSEQFSKKVTALGARANFVIGGATGIPKEIAPKTRWSLSPLTFTHQMTRLILVEQLYRALEISQGSSYHK